MHHSPSSLATAEACERKWWYDHVERRREPEVTWEQIEAAGDKWQEIATSRQRSAARGTAVHALLEAYYEGGSPDWTSYIGQIAITGRAHLPHREACLEIRIEHSIGDDPYPRIDPETGATAEPDRTALVLDGIRFLGYVDLDVRLDPDGAEAKRLGIAEAVRAGDGWYTFDYKTSKDVDRYAITPEKVRTDPQGILYPVAGMISAGTSARGMRWVYMQTEGKRYAKPVDALVTYDGTKAHLRALVDRGRDLEQKQSIEDCMPNPDACQDYGGCPHHVTRGGPCEARRKLGRMIKMGFREDFLKNVPNGAALATAPAEAAAPAQTTTTPAPPKRGFGKKAEPQAAAPANPPAGANGPAVDAPVQAAWIAVTEAASSAPSVTNVTNVVHAGPADSETTTPARRARAAAPKPIASQIDSLIESVRSEFMCDELGAFQIVTTLMDVRENAARNAK